MNIKIEEEEETQPNAENKLQTGLEKNITGMENEEVGQNHSEV